jgi:hypothetical protein
LASEPSQELAGEQAAETVAEHRVRTVETRRQGRTEGFDERFDVPDRRFAQARAVCGQLDGAEFDRHG